MPGDAAFGRCYGALVQLPKAASSEDRGAWGRGPRPLLRGVGQNTELNNQYSEPDSRMAAGKVSTQAITRLRMVRI